MPGRQFPGPRGGSHVVVFTEHFNATYFISFEIPLERLRQQGRLGFSAYSQADVQAHEPGAWRQWILRVRPQAVVLTRYGRADGVQIIAFCRSQGIPVIYHIDDDLLELPDSLGAAVVQRHASPEVVNARRDMLADSDLVYASTSVLAGVLQARFPQQRIFHGIYAPFLAAVLPDLPGDEAPEVIGYMGSRGHQEDLALALPAVARLMRERPRLRFETFGTVGMPSELAQFGDRVQHHAVQQSYGEFLKTLAGLRWRVGLAPLVDAPFNRCKAPTKFIEYSSCGIATAASDVVVYASAMPPGGGELVRDDWYHALARMLDEPGRARACVETARAHCASVYGEDALARQVLHVLELVTPTDNAARRATA
jgi:glycosyltransferase involved in cell wall biosynthesis